MLVHLLLLSSPLAAALCQVSPVDAPGFICGAFGEFDASPYFCGQFITSDVNSCHLACFQDARCQSIGYQGGTCMLYSKGIRAGGFRYDATSTTVFYHWRCHTVTGSCTAAPGQPVCKTGLPRSAYPDVPLSTTAASPVPQRTTECVNAFSKRFLDLPANWEINGTAIVTPYTKWRLDVSTFGYSKNILSSCVLKTFVNDALVATLVSMTTPNPMSSVFFTPTTNVVVFKTVMTNCPVVFPGLLWQASFNTYGVYPESQVHNAAIIAPISDCAGLGSNKLPVPTSDPRP